MSNDSLEFAQAWTAERWKEAHQRIKELEAERDLAIAAERREAEFRIKVCGEMEEKWLAAEARLAAAELVVEAARDESTGWGQRLTAALAAYDSGDWVQKSEWVDPIVKDVLSGKRKRADLNFCEVCRHPAHPTPPEGERCGCYDPAGACGGVE